MSCPECGGGWRQSDGGALRCERCRLSFVPIAAMETLCASIERHYVASDVDRLERECKERRQALVAAGLGGARPVQRDCPTCGERMLRRGFAELSGIVVHECRAHGQLVGDDQLRAITDFVRRGGEVLALRTRLADAEADRERADRRVRDAEQLAAGQGSALVVGPWFL